MKRTLAIAAFLFTSAATWAHGQEFVIPKGLPTAALSRPAAIRARTEPERKAFDWKMTLLDGSLRGIAALDVKSTYDTAGRCVGGCVESNPYAAWFINRGPRVAYPATMAFDTGVTLLAIQMRKSSHPVIRRIWFVPHLALIAGHALAARSNYELPHGATVGLRRP